MQKVIFLYDKSGLMAEPWLKAGYECWCFDGQHKEGVTREGNLVKVGMWFSHLDREKQVKQIKDLVGAGVKLVFGFPECTYLCTTSNRWFYHPDDKDLPTEQRRPHPKHPDRKRLRDEAALLALLVPELGESLNVPWALENPKSQLATLWRKSDFKFNPYEYGGYLPEDDVHPLYPEYIKPRDAYPKETYIWMGNGFKTPTKKPVPVEKGYSDQHSKLGGKSLKTKNIRSATPRGFALAVYEANK